MAGLKLLLEGIDPARQRKRLKLTTTSQEEVYRKVHSVNCSDVTTRIDTPATTPHEVSQLNAAQLAQLVCTQATAVDSLQQHLDGLKHQLDWFKRQITGQMSERFASESDPTQLPLAAVITIRTSLF